MNQRIEPLFLERYAGKHFVALKYILEKDGNRFDDYASCFVLEVRGSWFLVTSGHWINDPETGLKHRLASGYSIKAPRIVDVFAGTNFPPLPMDFNLEGWAAVDDDQAGLDLAIMQIDPFVRRGLESAGVVGISAEWVQALTFTPESQVMLVGVPSESFHVVGDDGSMKFVVIPVTEYDGDAMPRRGCSVVAALPENPEDPRHRVDSIVGMSGCPVFKLNTGEKGPNKYWLVGIQSSWRESARVVRITPVDVLVDALEAAIDKTSKARGAQDRGQVSNLKPDPASAQ